MNKSRTAVVAAFALVLFVWLAYLVSHGGMVGFDGVVRREVHGWASPVLTWPMIGITSLGSDAVLITAGAGFVAWLIMRRRYRDMVLFIATSLAAWLFYTGLNAAFHRPRPLAFFGLPTPGGFSFPSGHAVKSMVVYPAMAMLGTRRPIVRAGAVGLACLIGLSRVYLGMHYPTDVLAGWAVAVFCLVVLRRRTTRGQRRIPVCPSE